MRKIADRFVLEREVGSGGMARVFLGRDEVLDRPVAVKVLKPMHGDTEIGVRFRREGRTAARLSHPNIVQVYDAGEAELDDREASYIVMEYLSGGDLKELIDGKGKLSGAELAGIGSEVCSGLAHAHGRGVVHRDIKPHNIMLDDHGRAKVSDFGIARALDTTQATRTGAYLGTALYSSPEQLQGHKVTPKSDVYSLGTTLYQAAAGEAPFTGTPIEIASQHVSKPPPPLKQRDTELDVGEDLEALILACLAKDPDDRPSAEEAGSRLAGMVPAPAETPDEAAAPPPPPRPERQAPTAASPQRDSGRVGRGGRTRGALTALALLAVLVAAGALALPSLFGGEGSTAQNGAPQNGAPQNGARQNGAPQNNQANVAGQGGGGSNQEDNGDADQGQQAAAEPTTIESSASASASSEPAGPDQAPASQQDEPEQQARRDSTEDVAEQTVSDFYTSAADGNYERSSQLLTAGYRQSTWPSQATFSGTFDTLQSVQFTSGPTAQVEGSTATVSFSTVARHTDRVDRPNGTATLVRQGEEWRIDSLDVG